MSKIEQIITEIEEYIDSCKFQPLSNSKIIVNKDEIDELLSELRIKIPDEIRKYQKIIQNKQAILEDAKARAEDMLTKAQEHKIELVSEHEVMQQAYAQANEVIENATNQARDILDKATTDANMIRTGAIQYTDEILASVQNIVAHTVEDSSVKFEALNATLVNTLEMVQANRKELNPGYDTLPDEDSLAQEIEDSLNDEGYEDYAVDFKM